MTVSKDLREGVRQALVDAGVVTTGQVFFSAMPGTPDLVVVITIYPVPLPHRHGVQVRARGLAGSTTSAEDLADAAEATLHGLTNQVWGETRVSLLHLVSGARIGADGSRRDEVTRNFHAVTSAPSTSLVD